MEYKIFKTILWYTLLTSGVVVILDAISIFKLLSSSYIPELIFLISSITLELVVLIIIINLLKGHPLKYSNTIVIFYWLTQIVFFGIRGNTFCFTTGPNISVIFKYLGHIESRVIFRLWTQELTLNINTISDRVYLGVNLIPLLISGATIYYVKKIKTK